MANILLCGYFDTYDEVRLVSDVDGSVVSSLTIPMSVSSVGLLTDSHIYTGHPFTGGQLKKHDLLGNLVWSLPTDIFGVNSIAIDSSGYLYVASAKDINDNTLHKVSSDGVIVWEKNIFDLTRCVYVDANDNVCISGTKVTKNVARVQAYDGTVIWSASTTATGSTGVIADNEGNVYLVTNHASTHYNPIKYDSQGTLVEQNLTTNNSYNIAINSTSIYTDSEDTKIKKYDLTLASDWTYDVGSIIGTIEADENYVYVGAANTAGNKCLTKLNADTGDLVWETDFGLGTSASIDSISLGPRTFNYRPLNQHVGNHLLRTELMQKPPFLYMAFFSTIGGVNPFGDRIELPDLGNTNWEVSDGYLRNVVDIEVPAVTGTAYSLAVYPSLNSTVPWFSYDLTSPIGLNTGFTIPAGYIRLRIV